MVWNYRVVRQETDDCVTFGIHEVYYDDASSQFKSDPDRTIWAITENPVTPTGETFMGGSGIKTAVLFIVLYWTPETGPLIKLDTK